MDWELFTTTLAICICGGLLQGISGFGFGIVVMSVLPLMMDIKQASPFVALLTALICLAVLPSYWKNIRWNECRIPLLALLIGLPIGIWGLENLPKPLIMRLLGASLLAVCIQRALKQGKQIFPRWIGAICGLLSGLLSGALNMGGPPMLLYLRGRPMPSAAFVATLHLLFTFSSCTRVGLAASAGLIDQTLLLKGILIVLPAAAAMLLGARIRDKIPEAGFQRLLQIMLFVFGMYYLLKA
ncbi:MAG: sulfite exporter TauE/SafE family protein [Chthoniobacterales bacterium]